MTLLKIARMGHPVLLAEAATVMDPTSAATAQLATDMIETMLDAGGVGLAAPQVYRSVRLIVVLPLSSREDDSDPDPLVLVNPELTAIGEQQTLDFEGCLSMPEIRGQVPRFERVHYRAVDLTGRPIEGEATGFFARVLQHEVDHLDGILFPMRMPDLRSLCYKSELHHQRDTIEAEATV